MDRWTSTRRGRGEKRSKAVDNVKLNVWLGQSNASMHRNLEGTGIMGLTEQTILNSGSGRGSARAHGAKTEFGMVGLENSG